ncbi:GNAT family N-acetyltransferase [Sphaerotilaceae bacterium SBD11-9]
MTEFILHTERLALRRFDAGDAGFILTLVNDPGWIQAINDPGVRTLDDAREWIDTRLTQVYARQGFGFWAVLRRGDPQPIGLCGLIKRDTLPEVDVGYAFLPAFRGQGYAREAARGCLVYGRDVLGLKRILAITSPDNLASQRVLEAAGMRLEDRRTLAGQERESLVYAWEANAAG